MAAQNPGTPWQIFQREVTFKLATFRAKGRSASAHGLSKRAPKLQVPKRGFYRGLKPYTQRRPRPVAYDEAANSLGVGYRHNAHDAKTRRIWLQGRVSSRGLVLVHTLGWGGNGLAALFSRAGQNGAPRQYFVAKCALRDLAAARRLLREESGRHHRYRGALHIVQKKGFPPRLVPQPGQRPPADVLLLEYLCHGDLHKVLCTITQRGARLPDRALWMMFHCPCIAVEFPPQQHPQIGPLMNPMGFVNGQLSSELTLPAPPGSLAQWDYTSGRPGGGSGMVHFDIDPQNIMMGGNDGPPNDDHPLFPILKLGDFGLAMQMTPAVMLDETTIWEARTRSKLDYLTPEQFTEEWDWVTNLPGPLVTTAGKYSHFTNLYQLALVMANAITGSYNQCPPVHSQMEITDPNNPGQRLTVWTYGGHLLHSRYRHVDVLLRRLVAQCLCDQPAHRPHLEDLKLTIETHLAHHNWQGRNAAPAVQQWTANVLGHPPAAPAAPVPPYWVDTPTGTPLPP